MGTVEVEEVMGRGHVCPGGGTMRIREATDKQLRDTRTVLRFILFSKLLPLPQSGVREWRSGFCVIRQQVVRVFDPDMQDVYLAWADREWSS